MIPRMTSPNDKIKALTNGTTAAQSPADCSRKPTEASERTGYRAARARRTSASLSAPLTTPRICNRAAGLASGSEDLLEKDAQHRRQAMMTTPTLDDENDEFSSK